MDFASWIEKLSGFVEDFHPGTSVSELDPDAMYQAFANGVSPHVFAAANPLPKKNKPPAPKSDLESVTQKPPVQFSPNVIPDEPAKNALKQLGERRAFQAPLDSSSDPINWKEGNGFFRIEKESWGVASLLAVVAVIAILIAINSANQTDSPAGQPSSYSIPPAVKQAENPLTDQQKCAKAKLELSSWHGDNEVFNQISELLDSVKPNSPQYALAKNLHKRWDLRKEAADRYSEQQSEIQAKLDAKREAHEARAKLAEEKASMNTFTGDGDGKVAVSKATLKRSIGDYSARGNSRYVVLYVDVRNFGSESININPNDFTLSTEDGETAAYDSQTFETSHPFEAEPLSPGQEGGGWLVFLLEKQSRYKLTRRGGYDEPVNEKTVIVN